MSSIFERDNAGQKEPLPSQLTHAQDVIEPRVFDLNALVGVGRRSCPKQGPSRREVRCFRRGARGVAAAPGNDRSATLNGDYWSVRR